MQILDFISRLAGNLYQIEFVLAVTICPQALEY